MNTKKLLKSLISIKSVSGDEKNIQGFIFGYIKSLSFKPIWQEGNVVVQVKGNNPQKCLIFNAHVDTVGVGNSNLWKKGPFSGEVSEGKMYGLGASDEKATVATQLELAEYFSKNKPACDVWLTFMIKEEVDGSGTKLFLDWFTQKYAQKYTKIAGVLGEPTGLKTIELAHKGNIFIKITTFGKSGHGSSPHKEDDHAVLKMFEVIQSLKELEKVWQKDYVNKVLGTPSIALATSISAGDVAVPNKYPDSCVATFDVRTTPEIDINAFSELKKAVDTKGLKIELIHPPVGCGFTDQNSVIAKIFKKISKAKFDVSQGSNDMCFFTQKGIPAVVFGPGKKEIIHSPNEFCELENIDKCESLYKEVIKSFGGNP